MAPSTVWELLKAEGVDPAPNRSSVTWPGFLRSQAEAILAMDFIETVTLTGQRQYILAVIHHASRRVRIVGTTAHPTHAWVTQAVRNLLMDLEDVGHLATVRFLIRDRDAKYPALMDQILQTAGIATVLTGVQVPRMNAVMERWVRTLRTELLDRTLIWNEPTCVGFCGSTSGTTTSTVPIVPWPVPHPCEPSPHGSNHPRSNAWTYADATESAESSTSTGTPLDLHGQGFRHPQPQRPGTESHLNVPGQSQRVEPGAGGWARF